MELNNKKTWIIFAFATAVLLSFVLSESFRNTFNRKQAIAQSQKELLNLTKQIDETKQKVNQLETNPNAYEGLVRQELGYMRPTEKEVRFLKK